MAWTVAGILAFVTVLGVIRFGTGKSVAPSSPEPAPDIQTIKAKAEAGDAEAQQTLGTMYVKGQSVIQDYAAAAKWYRLAANQGNPEGQNSLGELYEAGQGVKRDEVQAAQWYRKAADQGNVGGEYNLAVLYEFGRGVPKDPAQAGGWFGLAADQGDGLAQFDIGQRCERGLGVPVDRVEAYKWYSLAAAENITDAAKFRDDLKSNMSREEIAEGKRRARAFVPKKIAPRSAR